MVRISDGRMSGTAYGTVVLHTNPGSSRRRARWRWSATATWSNRRARPQAAAAYQRRGTGPPLSAWTAHRRPLSSGYWKLYVDHVLQPTKAPTWTSWSGKRGAFVPRDNH
jgi:dihydroxy-acid dehydratase